MRDFVTWAKIGDQPVQGKHTETEINRPATLEVETKLAASDWGTIKCHRCYGYDVDSVCHHTGRFMCSDCSRKSSTRFWRRDKVFARLKPLPKGVVRQAAHSREFFHRDHLLSFLSALALSVVILIVLVGVWLSQPVVNARSISLYGLGLLIGVWLGKWFFDYLWVGSAACPFGVPVFARINVEVRERVQADFDVAGGEYLTLGLAPRGVVEVSVHLTPADLARYKRLRRPAGVPANQPINFHAGFVGLEMLKNVKFLKPEGRRQDNLLVLTRPLDLDTFETCCLQKKSFELIEPYHIQAEALKIGPLHDKEFPLAIKPRLENGNRRLKIILEVPDELSLEYPRTNRDKETKKGPKARVWLKSLVLRIPPGCELEHSDGHYNRGRPPTVTWGNTAMNGDPVFSVFLEFSKPLGQQLEFSGQYIVVIEHWTISQLHVGHDVTGGGKPFIRLANGLRPPKSGKSKEQDLLIPAVSHNTTFKGGLLINTTSLLSQNVQVRSNFLAAPRRKIEEVSKKRLPVMPDHEMINAVLEALTPRLFTRQVTETRGPVKENDTGSSQARHWEICGKDYLDKLHPVDFHLVMTGEGPMYDRPNGTGRLVYELSLRSYVKVDDSFTPGKLKDDYEELEAIIRHAAYKGRQIDYQGRRVWGWQIEQQLEEMYKWMLQADQIAFILNGHGTSPLGYIFCAPQQGPGLPPKLVGWQLARRSRLPTLTVEKQEWIDKWLLLNEV